MLAAVAPTESLSQYDLLITGHSLGGALATLFTADIAEFGMDAGRALPQLVTTFYLKIKAYPLLQKKYLDLNHYVYIPLVHHVSGIKNLLQSLIL